MNHKVIIDADNRKTIEAERRAKLKREKPLVYDKILKYDEKAARGECTAIVDFCFDYKCNMHCTHCCNARFAKKSRALTINDLADFTRQLDELGMAQYNVSGGEPLAFDNLDEIIKACQPERFHIAISSNGFLLTREKAFHLKKMGVDKIRISLDSFDESKYLETRQKPEAYSKAVQALVYAKEAGMQTGINTMLSHQNCHTKETESLAKFANENGYNLDILIARAIGNLEGKEEILITPDDNQFLMELRNKFPVVHRDTFPTYGQDCGCGTVQNILHLTKYGDILPCTFIHISIGNIFEEPLKDIIKRGQSIKWFHDYCPLCLSGEHKGFIRKYMTKFYGKPLPISWKDAFTDEDFIA